MSIKKTYLWTYFRLLKNLIPNSFKWNKYAIDLGNTLKKMEVNLSIKSHSLEKGMSLGHTRPGFGQSKAEGLIIDLDNYLLCGGSPKTVQNIAGILSKYIDFNKFPEDSEVVRNFRSFCNKHKIIPSAEGGILTVKKSDIEDYANGSFKFFSQSRFAIRDFGTTPINHEAIERALSICERTPSACNRQPWHVYIISDKCKRDQLLECQGGVKGCNDDIQSAILICGDISNYALAESNLPYVDGGLYAMNLMYALHYEGIANIPLSMCYDNKRVNSMKKIVGISDNEVPILLIAIGSYKNEFKVAVSSRKSHKEYTTIV